MVSIFWGFPRCGKTTLATFRALRASSRGRHVYTNVPLKIDAFPEKCRPFLHIVPNSYFGKYDMSGGLIQIDEASVYADSRQFAKFPPELVEFFVEHGHYHVDIELYAQIYNRIDSTIRMLCEKLYWVKKPFFTGWFRSKVYRVPYGVAFTPPPEGTGSKYGDITEGYCEPSTFGKIFAFQLWRRKYYKLFDSYARKPLPPMPEVTPSGIVGR